MKDTSIKRSSALFLQVFILLIGIATLAFLLGEPHFEGRNVGASVFEIYFNDPFLAYVYGASIAFFVALYKAFTVLRDIGNNKAFSIQSVRALRTIKYCALALIAFIAGAEAFIIITMGGKDDIAGGVAMGIFAMLVSVVIAITAAVCERIVHK